MGVRVDALFVTESAPITFTRLPIREGEHALVWFGTVSADAGLGETLARSIGDVGVPGEEKPLVLELGPTPRSLLGRS